ncbi:hypothetical protein I79_001623 [Cricetulus griseus]|uniref:Uncharacterized protein n=1 Tax=Cricetulus griseus TaxID=10029 RepID=G3GV92_CRIGR|nr:hypothetical protein I79_001623 [Cricetulus griseus]
MNLLRSWGPLFLSHPMYLPTGDLGSDSPTPYSTFTPQGKFKALEDWSRKKRSIVLLHSFKAHPNNRLPPIRVHLLQFTTSKSSI